MTIDRLESAIEGGRIDERTGGSETNTVSPGKPRGLPVGHSAHDNVADSWDLLAARELKVAGPMSTRARIGMV